MASSIVLHFICLFVCFLLVCFFGCLFVCKSFSLRQEFKELTKLDRKWASGICFSLTSQNWNCGHMCSCWAFHVNSVGHKSGSVAYMSLLTEPSPELQLLQSWKELNYGCFTIRQPHVIAQLEYDFSCLLFLSRLVSWSRIWVKIHADLERYQEFTGFRIESYFSK